MHVCTLAVEGHLPACTSLKAKRSVIRPLLEGSAPRFHVAAAEVDFQDQWQRTALAFVAVAGDPAQVESTLDTVERFVWSHVSST